MSIVITMPDEAKLRLDEICVTVGAKPNSEIGYKSIIAAALELYEDVTKLQKTGNKFHMTKPTGEVVEYDVG